MRTSAVSFNRVEQGLLDRLYAEAEKHMLGPRKNLEALKLIVPHRAEDWGLSAETFIRIEEDDLTLKILNIKLSLLKSKQQQIENFLKNPAEKQAGKMLSLEELKAWIEVLRQREIDRTMHVFMGFYFQQKRRYVPRDFGVGIEADDSVRWESFNSLELAKLSPALQSNIEQFRQKLSKRLELASYESASADPAAFPALPEGYLLNEYLPEEVTSYFDSKTASSKVNYAKVRMESPILKVEQHAEEYAAQVETYLAQLKAASERANAKLNNLMEDPSLHERELSYVRQKIEDNISIQLAVISFSESLRNLCADLAKELELIPLREVADSERVLSDSLTTTELLVRMLVPEKLLLKNAEEDFKDYLKTVANIYIIDPETGCTLSQSLSDPSFRKAYCKKYLQRVKENLAPLQAEWKAWDLTEDPRDHNDSKTVSPAVREQVELKLKLLKQQIAEIKMEVAKVAAKVARNEHLKDKIREKDADYSSHKQIRFIVMVGEENWKCYQLMLNHRKVQWALYKALPAEPPISWKDFYADRHQGVECLLENAEGEEKGLPEMLVTFFPGVSLETASLLLEEGIPSNSYRSEDKNNLLHIALGNSPADYDASLVSIAQYLLSRGVNAWQSNAKGLRPGVIIRAFLSNLSGNVDTQTFQYVQAIEAVQINATDWRSIMKLTTALIDVRKKIDNQKTYAQQIDNLCMEAAVLASSREDFKELRLEVNRFLAKARALIAAESERSEKYRADPYGVARLFTFRPMEDLSPYEHALSAGHLSPFSILEDLLNLPSHMPPAKSSEFLKQFSDLLQELNESEAVKQFRAEIKEGSNEYREAIVPELPAATVEMRENLLNNMARQLREVEAQLAVANERAGRAEAEVTVANRRADRATAEAIASRQETVSVRQELTSAKAETVAANERAEKAEGEARALKQQIEAGTKVLSGLGAWKAPDGKPVELDPPAGISSHRAGFLRK